MITTFQGRFKSLIEDYQLGLNDLSEDLPLNRLEVVDDNGRAYVNWNDKNNISFSLQDEGKTLKIFITQNK